jgi:hypothetical protein
MKQGRKHMVFAGIVCTAVLASFVVCAYAQDDQASEAAEAAEWKAQLESDKAAISAQKDEMKSNSEAAKSEEKVLLDQIKAAEQSGDRATARSLRGQLKSTHQDNISEMKSDKAELKESRQTLQSDRKAAKTDRVDRNDDGTVDRTEKKAARGARSGRR